MSSQALAKKLIDSLVLQGVRYFVVCAGSRNSTLAIASLECHGITVFHHFEEREAAFFAVGLSKKEHLPVCVITTSGTASAELLPTCVEAHYSGAPLVLVTADRPSRFRGTGAPQSIEQRGLYGEYCLNEFDICEDDFESINISRHGPTHINICFEEHSSTQFASNDKNYSICNKKPSPGSENFSKRIANFLLNAKNPLIIVGELNRVDRRSVIAFCCKVKAPVFAETLSGLRESDFMKDLLIVGGERVLQRGNFDSILRIGSVPVCRYWRDLEGATTKKTLSIDRLPFSGSPNSEIIHGDIATLLSEISDELPRFSFPQDIQGLDKSASEALHSLLYKYPHSEPGLFYQLSHIIHEHDSTYLGNSLPIREWELAATRKKPHAIVNANRGANGIDGQLSTFFGTLDGTRHNWGCFGDLTSLYGLASPWVLNQLPGMNATICIFNNNGGRIFERVASVKNLLTTKPVHDFFTNNHSLQFKEWAAMWSLNYEAVSEFSTVMRRPGISVVEISPDAGETDSFWKGWDNFWNV